MKEYLKKLIAVMVAIAMVIMVIPSQAVEAASKPKLNTTKKTLLVGSKFTLKVKNAEKGSTLTWKSSNSQAVTVSKKGVVKAVAGGESIVSCKVKTTTKTYNLKATIKSKDSKTVSTQKALNTALANEAITKITIKTDEAKKLTIAKGDYTNKLLIVDAPKVEVANNGGVFKKIAIRSIAPNTWIERAKGNTFTVSAPNARVVVGKNADVKKVSLTKVNANVKLDIRGDIGKVSMNKSSNLELVGKTVGVNVEVSKNAEGSKILAKMLINIVAKALTIINLEAGAEGSSITIKETAKGSEIKAEVPVNVETKTDVAITLEKGAEESKISVTEKDAQVKVENETESDIAISTPEGDKTVNAGSTVTDANTGNTESDNTENNNTGNENTNQGSNSGAGTDWIPNDNLGNGGDLTVNVTGIELSETEATLTVGETKKLTATVLPSNATNKTVTWTSSNEEVATVANGVVTAVAEGEAIITATAGNKTATCKVTVEKVEEPKDEEVAVTEITLSETEATLTVGETKKLTATVLPSNATNKTVTWTSSNEEVATVVNGVVTAVVKGEATITAKAGEKTATCKVTVETEKVEEPKDEEVAVTGIELSETEATLKVDETKKLTAIVLPENATNKTVTWISSNEEVATVVNGVVTAVAKGEVTITAQAGEKTATCKVTVIAKTEEPTPEQPTVVTVSGITLNTGALSLQVGEKGTLTATVSPSDATDKTVTWTSSNTAVATVSNGEVTAVAEGTATITAQAGEVTATCEVTVSAKKVEPTVKIVEATVQDFNTAGEVVTDYEVEFDAETSTVTLKGRELQKHTNANQIQGHWIGFGIEFPEGVNAISYTWDDETSGTANVTEGSLGIYVNMLSDGTANHKSITVSFTEGDYTYTYTYQIDTSNVTLA